MIAIWRERGFSQEQYTCLRVAVWDDGRVVFDASGTNWSRGLLQGHVSLDDLLLMKEQLVETGVFQLFGRKSYLVPDGTELCLALSLADQKLMMRWDENETKGYGANINPTAEYAVFKRVWCDINRIVLSFVPKEADPLGVDFPGAPFSWYTATEPRIAAPFAGGLHSDSNIWALLEKPVNVTAMGKWDASQLLRYFAEQERISIDVDSDVFHDPATGKERRVVLGMGLKSVEMKYGVAWTVYLAGAKARIDKGRIIVTTPAKLSQSDEVFACFQEQGPRESESLEPRLKEKVSFPAPVVWDVLHFVELMAHRASVSFVIHPDVVAMPADIREVHVGDGVRSVKEWLQTGLSEIGLTYRIQGHVLFVRTKGVSPSNSE